MLTEDAIQEAARFSEPSSAQITRLHFFTSTIIEKSEIPCKNTLFLTKKNFGRIFTLNRSFSQRLKIGPKKVSFWIFEQNAKVQICTGWNKRNGPALFASLDWTIVHYIFSTLYLPDFETNLARFARNVVKWDFLTDFQILWWKFNSMWLWDYQFIKKTCF